MIIPKDDDDYKSCSLSDLPPSIASLFVFWASVRLTQFAVRTLSALIDCPDRAD